MKIKQVLNALEKFAPLPLQESWDNAGLQVGLTEADVSGVLLCLDVTEAVMDEALAEGCNLIVSHHPLLFHGIKQLTDGNMVNRCVIKAVKHDIAVVSMHTNMDNARNGVNWKIAEHMGLRNVRFMACKAVAENVEAGSGVVGELASAMAAADFISMVKERFGVKCAMCNELLERPVRKVAICGGAGDFLLDTAVEEGADAFVTGEMHYHQYFGYGQRIQICVTGHYESEQFTTEVFRDIIKSECPGVEVKTAHTNTNPILYI